MLCFLEPNVIHLLPDCMGQVGKSHHRRRPWRSHQRCHRSHLQIQSALKKSQIKNVFSIRIRNSGF